MVIVYGRGFGRASFIGGTKIDYKRLYENERDKNARLERQYQDVISERNRAERKALDVINQYEKLIYELESLRVNYRELLTSLSDKYAECEQMRRTLVIILNEIKKMDPRKIGLDIDTR